MTAHAPAVLNSLTREEMAEIVQRANLGKTRCCPYCEKEFTIKRTGQTFCSSEHQRKWHSTAVPRLEAQLLALHEAHAQERERWHVERDALIKEISELKNSR